MSVIEGSDYTDAGATCLDDIDGTIPVITNNPVDVKTAGSYDITYNCSDSAGNKAPQVVRTVDVNNAPPILHIVGSSDVTINLGSLYLDQGATCIDETDGNIAATVVNYVNTSVMGTYNVTYSCTDSGGISASPIVRMVTVYGVDPTRNLDEQILSGEIVIPPVSTLTIIATGPDQITIAWPHVIDSTHYDITAFSVVGSSVDHVHYITDYNVSTITGLSPDVSYNIILLDSDNNFISGDSFMWRTLSADSDLQFWVQMTRVAPIPNN